MDTHTQHLGEVLAAAAAHKGTSFVEVYQNCIIFNPNEWGPLQDRKNGMIISFTWNMASRWSLATTMDKGIRLNGFKPEVVELGDEYTEDDLIVHDEQF